MRWNWVMQVLRNGCSLAYLQRPFLGPSLACSLKDIVRAGGRAALDHLQSHHPAITADQAASPLVMSKRLCPSVRCFVLL